MEVLLIGLVHAIPVLGVGLWKRGDWKWLDRSAVVMGAIAILTGALVLEFLVIDLLAVAAAWWLVRQSWRKQGL